MPAHTQQDGLVTYLKYTPGLLAIGVPLQRPGYTWRHWYRAHPALGCYCDDRVPIPLLNAQLYPKRKALQV